MTSRKKSTKKKVSFIAKGKRVTFYKKTTSKSNKKNRTSKKYVPKKTTSRKRTTRPANKKNSKLQRDTERFVDASLALVHPAAPAVVAGARLLKDLFDE